MHYKNVKIESHRDKEGTCHELRADAPEYHTFVDGGCHGIVVTYGSEGEFATRPEAEANVRERIDLGFEPCGKDCDCRMEVAE